MLPVIRLPGGAAELSADEFDTTTYVTKLRNLLPVGQVHEAVNRELCKVRSQISALLNENESSFIDMVSGFRAFAHNMPILKKHTEDLREICHRLKTPACDLRLKLQSIEEERQMAEESAGFAAALLSLADRLANHNHLLLSLQYCYEAECPTFLELLAVDVQRMGKQLSDLRHRGVFPVAVDEIQIQLDLLKACSTEVALSLLDKHLETPAADFIGRCVATLAVFGEEESCAAKLQQRFFDDVVVRELAKAPKALTVPSRSAAEASLKLLQRLEPSFVVAATALQGSPGIARRCVAEPFLRFVREHLPALLAPINGDVFARGFRQVCKVTGIILEPLNDAELNDFVMGPWSLFCSYWQTLAYETARCRELFNKVNESMGDERQELEPGSKYRLKVVDAVTSAIEALLSRDVMIEKERRKIVLEVTQLLLIYLLSYVRELKNAKSPLLVLCLRDLLVVEQEIGDPAWCERLKPPADSCVLERGIAYDTALVSAKLDALTAQIHLELGQERQAVGKAATEAAVALIAVELNAAKAVPPLYRMTNKQVPQTPSPYINVVLEHLERWLVALREAPTATQYMEQLGVAVLEQAAAVVSSVMASVEKQERALKRVAKRALVTGVAGVDSMSDEAKIGIQLQIDLQSLREGVTCLLSPDVEMGAALLKRFDSAVTALKERLGGIAPAAAENRTENFGVRKAT